MSRILYDAAATNAGRIPSDAQYVAGGPAWTDAEIALFPQAVFVPIANDVNDLKATVLDVERKYVWPPAAAVPWVQGRQALGFRGTVYVWQGNLLVLDSALALAGLTNVLYWVSDQTGVAHSMTVPGLKAGHIVATQWCGYSNGPIAEVDQSVISDPYWLMPCM